MAESKERSISLKLTTCGPCWRVILDEEMVAWKELSRETRAKKLRTDAHTASEQEKAWAALRAKEAQCVIL